MRASHTAPSASPAPTASSQARAGRRKNASGASVDVQTIDRTKEIAATTPTVIPTRRRFVPRPATISRSAGQNR